jgi:predicted O-methyltransferase YrrM
MSQKPKRVVAKMAFRLINLLNKDLNEYNKYFVQYLPDRYSPNLKLYEKEHDFFEYSDLKKWTEGNYKNNSGDITRFFGLNLCIEQLIEEKIEGDVAELGVYRGNSAFLLAKFARRMKRRCFLFDTFTGFDSRDLKDDEDKTLGSLFEDTSLEAVRELVGNENAVYVKGFFPDSLKQIGETGDLALVHIDCDLESPMAAALDYFYPRIKKGGFLIMHDYSSLYWPGAKRAIDDFFRDKPEYVIPLPDKSGTCMIRKVE